jgi:hypothetical protein
MRSLGNALMSASSTFSRRKSDGNNSVEFLLNAHLQPRCERHSPDIDPVGPISDGGMCSHNGLLQPIRSALVLE